MKPICYVVLITIAWLQISAQENMPWTSRKCKAAQVNQVNKDDSRSADDHLALLRTISVCDEKGAMTLIRSGMQLDYEIHELTPLSVAIDYGENNIIRELLERGADSNRYATQTKATPLIAAALTGNVIGTKLLLQHGAQVNAKDTYGSTALMYAAERGHSEVVIALLHGGAERSLRDKFGLSARDHASMGNHVEIMRILEN